MSGTLYLVATPIGNRQDITLRAIEILKQVDFVACEDTRHTGLLLHALEIHKPLISYHEHNEARRTEEFLQKLQQGSHIALVSDAGTPLISDPGYRLVKACYTAGIAVTALPGPCAVINALVLSGCPPTPFYFAGFLPPKTHGRIKLLELLKVISATLIFYESPHRILKSLEDFAKIFPEREVVVLREMTKMFEERKVGKPAELLDLLKDKKPKGEWVIVVN